MEDGGGVGREKSHKRPHPSEDDDDDVEFISFKKEKRDPEVNSAKETEDDVVIVEDTQGATGTSANDAKLLGKEDFVVTYFKPSDTIKYPHAREDCRVHKFHSTIPSQPYGGNSKQENTTFCDSCYCYVCDIPAKECQQWIQGDHCNAHSKDTSWKLKRKKTVADNSRKKARQSFASHPSLRSSLSKEERETEGMSSFQDSSLDEILNRIDSTYKEYSVASEGNNCDYEDDCYCYCHEDSYWGRRRRRCWYDYDNEEESCYECEHNHYDGTSASYHDYDPVRRALNSAVTSARTHWQNKKPVEALVILEETMRSLCLHQPCEVTLYSYSVETTDGGLVSSKRAIMQSIEELLVDMFLDKSGILLSSLKEKALSAIKRTFDLAPQNSGNIRPNIALGLKSWDDQELLAVLNGSHNSGKDKADTASSLRGNSTAEVIVVEDSTSQSNTAGHSRNSNFTEDYLVVKKRLQILENEKRWQEAANYIQKVNIRGSQYGIESHLKDKLLTYQAHLGKWNEVRLELIKIMPNQAGRIRLVRMEPTDFLNIMKCFTTGQDIEMMPASSPSTATPSPGVNMDEVFRIYLYAMATGQNYSLKHNEKCVSWFIAWTCQETLQELSLGEFQRLEKQAKSLIATSQTRVTNLEHMSNLNSKVGRAVTATCWLSSNLSSRSSSYLNVSTIMDGYKNNVWLAVFLLMKLCDDLKAYFSYGLSEACHKVANWITTHGGFVLQHGHPGSITLEKVLSLLPLVKAKELLENILAAVLTGDRTPEERVKIIQQAKRVVSKLTNNRQLMMGRILLYMAKDGQCKEVQEELMKEKQDAKFRPVKALAQIGDEDFLDIMKALVESSKKLWGANEFQAARYIENEIFLLCIYGLLWNDKVQQSMSFISWFLGLLCATTMEEPSDAMMKILEDIAKSIREAVDKRAAERKAASIVGKECKAVVACILALPGLKCREYSDQLKMKIILDALKENKWLLMFVLNRPDGPSGTVVTEWICEENGPKILNDLTEEATTRLVSFMDKGTGYDILKRLVTMSDKKGLGKKRRAVQFAMCLLNQLQKYDRTSNDILAFIMSKVDPIIRAIDDPSAKTFLQQMYQKNFEFCPTMKSLEELKKVCSPEEWLLKKDSCLVSYINDIKNISTFLSCLDLLMKSGSDHITELLSLPVAREGCTKRGDDAFNPACSAVIKKVAAVLKEIHSGEVTQFLQKARSWLVAESWGSLLCVGKSCKNKVQQSMDVLWKVIAEISPQELVNILKAAMEAVQGRLNVISVNLQMRNTYVGWLFRVKDAFQLGQQLFQFGQILHRNLGVLRRKKELTQAVRTSGLLHNLPNQENPLKQTPSMQNAKKKGNGASPNLSKALKTLNISNKGSGTSKDDMATLLMKELIAKKSSLVADTGGVKQQTTDATPMEWARSDTGDLLKKASRPSSSATSAQPAGKSADKHGYRTRSKDKSNVQSTGTRALAQTSPPTSASATGPNSSTASVVPKNAPNKTGEQNKGSPELVDIVSKILELTKTTGVDGAFQLIIGRMTGKVASSSPMTEDIISKLLKLKGPINLKIGNNKLVINSQLASSTPVIPNVPSPHPAQTMPAPRNVTTVPYADPTTDSISQSAPRHTSGRTGPNLGPRSVLLPPPATSSISTYVPGAMPTVSHTGGATVPGTPRPSGPVLPPNNSTPVTGALSSTSSSTTGLPIANNNNRTPAKPSTQAPSAKFSTGILKQIISTIDIKKGTASYRVVSKPGESSKAPSSDQVSCTEPMEVPMEVD